MAVRAVGGLRRTFITPEGVDLRLELGSAGARAAAFMIDIVLMLVILVVVTIGLAYLARGGGSGVLQFIAVMWLIGAFILRNGWFSLFEMGSRGATPGKRILGLRVVARDGARLTGAAVVARNAMREIEIFLPLSFLGAQAVEGTADTFLVIFALLWSTIFMLFPLFNRDRLRVGDLLRGHGSFAARKRAYRWILSAAAIAPPYFPPAALELYGIYELQTLEDVLRKENPNSIVTVAQMIRRKQTCRMTGTITASSQIITLLSAHIWRRD